MYCCLDPRLGLVIRKSLALLGVKSSEARWSSSSKSISDVKGYLDWKYNGFLLLVMLALSGPEEAFQWLLSQLLRYSFCGICGNELEGLALKKLDYKNHFFLTSQPFSFAIVYTGMVILGRNISVLCSYRSYCGQEYTQGCAHALR